MSGAGEVPEVLASGTTTNCGPAATSRPTKSRKPVATRRASAWLTVLGRSTWSARFRKFAHSALPLGSNFTRMTSTLSSNTATPLIVGIGISKRSNDNGRGFVTRDAEHGRLMFWEPDNPEHGSLGIALAVDPATVEGFAEDADNYLILVRVTPGQAFTYYMAQRGTAAWTSPVANRGKTSSQARASTSGRSHRGPIDRQNWVRSCPGRTCRAQAPDARRPQPVPSP